MKEIKRHLSKIIKIFGKEKSPKERALKVELSEIILHLRRSHKKKFGIFIIFGWKNKWDNKYADIPDMSQDIFTKRHLNISKFYKNSSKKIASTINFDGAILIDSNGNILHSGIIIEGLRPRNLANKISSIGPERDLSARLGFKKKVHSRHLSAIAASFQFKGTIVFTISEETGDLHIFKNGKILFSTVKGEGANKR